MNDKDTTTADPLRLVNAKIYTQADLDRARADGYNDGFRQGKQARASVTRDVCEHGIAWEMECLSCGPSDFVAVTAASSSPVSPSLIPTDRHCPHCDHLMYRGTSVYERCSNCTYQEGVASSRSHGVDVSVARQAAEEIAVWIMNFEQPLTSETDLSATKGIVEAIILKYISPVGGKQDAVVDEVQNRMDQVVEAAVEWHQAGREGAEWFEASEKLGAAIESLLELRGEPVKEESK